MQASKIAADKTAPALADDAGLLAQREVAQLSAEAKLGARAADLLQRERACAAKLARVRDELSDLTRSRARGMAVDALGRLPAGPASPGPLPEQLEALQARRVALDARQRALDAEERSLRRREQTLDRLDQDIVSVGQVLAAIQAKSQELYEAEQAQRAEEQRRRAEEAQAAAAREALRSAMAAGKDQARDAVASPAKRAPASGAIATGPQEAARPDASSRQRRDQRVELHADVDLFSDSNFYTGFSSDLSDGGIFVATCNTLDPGTEVEVAFTLPGSLRIQAKGVVRWHREYNDRFPDIFPGMGIEFVEMTEDSRLAVHAFTSQREPMFWAS